MSMMCRILLILLSFHCRLMSLAQQTQIFSVVFCCCQDLITFYTWFEKTLKHVEFILTIVCLLYS